MHRKLMMATAVTALLGLGACNRDTTEPVDDGVPAPGQTAESGAGPAGATETEMPAATTAQGFAMRAALSDMFEIQSSQMALERSQANEVKAFAQRMVTEHQTMTNELQSALQQANITVAPPSQLDQQKQEIIQQLRDASATDFDDRYIDAQTEAHENTLNLFRDYANNGDTPVLKQLASRSVARIEAHLQTVKALDRSEADDKAGRTDGNATLDRNAAGATPTANRP
jgi:putative membrane protein